MKYSTIFLSTFMIALTFVNAQRRPTTALYLETGGASQPSSFSLNYDVQLVNGEYVKIGTRVGVGLPVQSAELPSNFNGFSLPVGVNYAVGVKKVAVEMDLGFTPFLGNGDFLNTKTGLAENKNISDYQLFITPGIRYQADGGLLLKLTFPQSIRQKGLLGKRTIGHAPKMIPGLSVGYAL